MINHIVDIIVKPGRVWDFCKAIQDNLGIWRALPGFVDEIVLADPESNHIVAQTFWRSAEDADRFNRESFARVHALVQDLLAARPKTTTYRVAVSTNRTIVPEQNNANESAASSSPKAQDQAGAIVAQVMKAPPALFISGLELVSRLTREAQNLYNEAIDSALSAAAPPPISPGPYASGRPMTSESVNSRRAGAPLDMVRDTLSGLIAFVVPGPDPYSIAQGMSTTEAGGLDAGILDILISALNQSLPSPPGAPPAAAAMADALNQIANQVNPSAAGPFASPFARLSFPDKASVFQVIESNAQTRALAGVLPLIAFLVYSEAPVFDPQKRTLRGQPPGWRLSSYTGVADACAEFMGYYQNRRSVENSREFVVP